MGASRPLADGDRRSLDPRLTACTVGELASHARGDLAGILAHLMQVPGERYAESYEMEVWLRSRDAVFSDRGATADERLEAGVVSGRRDDGVGIQA